MLVRPWFFDFDLVYRLFETARGDNRDGQTLDALCGLDALAVVPMPLRILRAVKRHVFIALPDQVEKSLPGDVAGLDDANAHVKIHGRRWIGAAHRMTGAGVTRGGVSLVPG